MFMEKTKQKYLQLVFINKRKKETSEQSQAKPNIKKKKVQTRKGQGGNEFFFFFEEKVTFGKITVITHCDTLYNKQTTKTT